MSTDRVYETAATEARAEAEATLTASGESLELSGGAIDRYVDAVGTWAVIMAEWEQAGRPGTALGGATGSVPAPHPLLIQLKEARREATQLATTLGLDPLGRLRLARRLSTGRPPGAASAPDRQAPPRRRMKAVK